MGDGFGADCKTRAPPSHRDPARPSAGDNRELLSSGSSCRLGNSDIIQPRAGNTCGRPASMTHAIRLRPAVCGAVVPSRSIGKLDALHVSRQVQARPATTRDAGPHPEFHSPRRLPSDSAHHAPSGAADAAGPARSRASPCAASRTVPACAELRSPDSGRHRVHDRTNVHRARTAHSSGWHETPCRPAHRRWPAPCPCAAPARFHAHELAHTDALRWRSSARASIKLGLMRIQLWCKRRARHRVPLVAEATGVSATADTRVPVTCTDGARQWLRSVPGHRVWNRPVAKAARWPSAPLRGRIVSYCPGSCRPGA